VKWRTVLTIGGALVAFSAGGAAQAQNPFLTAAERAADAAAIERAETPIREIQIEIFGEDPCPVSSGNDVVVCARRPETERYRVPPNLRRTGQAQEQSWGSRVEGLEEASRDMRPNSCSTVGSFGQSGCTGQMIRQWFDSRRARRSTP
jgi:hypothetical protein